MTVLDRKLQSLLTDKRLVALGLDMKELSSVLAQQWARVGAMGIGV